MSAAPALRGRNRVLVAIATYEERDNLPRLLVAIWSAVDADVLVTDDASPDGTGQIADAIAAREPRLTVVHRPGKQGVASAHVAAFRRALAQGYDAVVEMDADFSHPPEVLPALIAACADADVALGSRLVPGARMLSRSRLRSFLTRAGCAYARSVLRLPLRDCTGGFRCTRSDALRRLDLDGVRSRGYAMQLELNQAWADAGMRFAEVPITFRDRTAGRSKMTAGIVVEAFLAVLRLRFDARSRVRAVSRAASEQKQPALVEAS
ncbi:MAG: polyprenol monophosphomannose synthase [Candidatus Dormibacteraeota bacterium]|nr:polyprenol monophosphomannose synthase [Candidatus Dormibacteraeota bacterium]MBV9524793.1 polyprenol monophosphomannose synthase [Candidatus Dormibacteraeota bacterium]